AAPGGRGISADGGKLSYGGSTFAGLYCVDLCAHRPTRPPDGDGRTHPPGAAVSDPLIDRFADACGATGPLDLRVDLAEGGVLAEGSVAQPFSLVGRDDACDVTLTDPEVNPRHAWLQVLGGRV